LFKVIIKNDGNQYVACGQFKRGLKAIFLVISEKGEMIPDPQWNLFSYRTRSNGRFFRKVNPYEEQFVSGMSLGLQKEILKSLLPGHVRLFLVALISEMILDKTTQAISPFYEIALSGSTLSITPVLMKDVPQKVILRVANERMQIQKEEDSGDYIY